MARGNVGNRVLSVLLDSKQRAFQQALLVPWRQLDKSASSYAGWHIFMLWVRAIVESAGELPNIVRSELELRCPGFLECEARGRADNLSIWKSLNDWVAAHYFADAKVGGWFDALMYYAYKDLRIEQAWSLWKRTRSDWHQNRPPRWPKPDQWTTDVLATRTLVQGGADQARAVEAMARVDLHRLRRAAWDLLEGRAFALWVDCVSKPNQALDEPILAELRKRYPGMLTSSVNPIWLPSLFSRTVHAGESEWCAIARTGEWYAALRYNVVHHPRYQRLFHYHQRCQDEWLTPRRPPHPSFADWLAAADVYCITR